jgi:gliding motility-associated lipoprotein GldH
MKIIPKIKAPFLLALSIAFFFMSCVDDTIYQQYVSINKNGWSQHTPAVFNTEINDTVGDYDVIINIRNKTDYPYQNLHLFVYSYSPDSVLVGDTLNCFLADNRGRWAGTGIGSTKNVSVLYMSNINFPKPGTYTFSVKQGMRDNILKGISDIGLRIQKVEK